MTLVIDASVAIKWVVAEADHADAIWLLSGDDELLLPDFAPVEIANILWKKMLRREVTTEQAKDALDFALNSRASFVASSDVLPRALEIAVELEHPIYDCVYLATAEQRAASLVTADLRLLRALKGTALAGLAQPLSGIAKR